MKQVALGNLTLSKILCGTNPFYGHAAFSAARRAEYMLRFDDAAIERVIQRCLDLGVNAVETSANERITAIVARLRECRPAPIHMVGSTRIDETSDLKSHAAKLAFLLEQRVDICVIHAQFVDRPRRGEEIRGLRDMVERIHGAGLLAAISTHRVETVELCERRNYGLDAYLFPLNLMGFAYAGYTGRETARERADLVRGVAKPFILIKTLAAGRIPPREGLQFIAENSKPNDVVSIGFGSEHEVAECLELAEAYF